MAHLYIIRGIPGSGKTTLANKMLACGMVNEVFEADQFMVNSGGLYSFDGRRLKECHDACKNAVRNALAAGLNVAVSNTFTRKWEMEFYLNLGVDHTILICQGEHTNTHGVPQEKVFEMANRFEYC